MKNMEFLQLLSGENCRLKILICMKMKKKYCELLSISDKDKRHFYEIETGQEYLI